MPENMLAGPAGFEPATAGVKVLCLTAWRRPYLFSKTQLIVIDLPTDLSAKFVGLQNGSRTRDI